MSYWKTKVLPKIKRYFYKSGKKKRAAAKACEQFESSKQESIEKELEEKREELVPKVIEIYKSSDAETKTIVKQPTDAGVTEHPTSVQTLLQELVKIGFPGALQVSEAAEKYGAPLVSGPVTFILQKTFTFITEESEVAPPGESSEPKAETAVETTQPETSDIPTLAEEQKSGDDVVTEKAETVETTPADDGKTESTVQVTETVPVDEPPKP